MFVVGDGDKLKNMKSLADKLELNGNIVFLWKQK